MIVAIIGSRDFSDLDAVRAYVASLPAGTVVISGGARGVDRTAVDAAIGRGLTTTEMFAEWKVYGKAAGFIRNEEIIKRADRVVAFWDGHSKGTSHGLRLAKEYGKPALVVRSCEKCGRALPNHVSDCSPQRSFL